MSDPEVLPAKRSRKESLTHKKDARLSHSVRELGRLGLSKHAVCVSLQIRDYTFKKYYLDEYLEGQSELQRGLASTAIQEAMNGCLLYTSPSPRDRQKSRMPSSA